MSWLLYGAYGYTGRLIAESAKSRGLDAVLAGRDVHRVNALGAVLELPSIAFPLDDHDTIISSLSRDANPGPRFSNTPFQYVIDV